jgi:hypothetical protein
MERYIDFPRVRIPDGCPDRPLRVTLSDVSIDPYRVSPGKFTVAADGNVTME